MTQGPSTQLQPEQNKKKKKSDAAHALNLRSDKKKKIQLCACVLNKVASGCEPCLVLKFQIHCKYQESTVHRTIGVFIVLVCDVCNLDMGFNVKIIGELHVFV